MLSSHLGQWDKHSFCISRVSTSVCYCNTVLMLLDWEVVAVCTHAGLIRSCSIQDSNFQLIFHDAIHSWSSVGGAQLVIVLVIQLIVISNKQIILFKMLEMLGQVIRAILQPSWSLKPADPEQPQHQGLHLLIAQSLSCIFLWDGPVWCPFCWQYRHHCCIIFSSSDDDLLLLCDHWVGNPESVSQCPLQLSRLLWCFSLALVGDAFWCQC